LEFNNVQLSDYTGRTCTELDDACRSNPCKNGQECHVSSDNSNGFVCDCNTISYPSKWNITTCSLHFHNFWDYIFYPL